MDATNLENLENKDLTVHLAANGGPSMGATTYTDELINKHLLERDDILPCAEDEWCGPVAWGRDHVLLLPK